MKPKYCGYAAIIGRPNVGKSTLLNQLLGQKISITSRKPQTTRYQILGVKTFKDIQVIYIDTPGLHAGTERTINRYMNRSARGTLRDVDAIVFVIEPHWESQDAWVLDNLKEIETPVFLVINKVDKIKNRTELLPLIEKVPSLYAFQKIIPLSAKTGDQLGTLEQEVHQLMPESPFYFPPGQVTDRSDQFMASEIIREKLMRLLGQEIPYSIAVTLIEFRKEEKIVHLSAVIWVEKKSQKGIVIGKKGGRLKRVGTNARLDMEKWFGEKVFLQLWVKVKSGWVNNERLLRELGFEE
ncbi:GTPase Era [Coxiella endosymbiont of Ornithodoros maritimus]|uniref:GTPase Era n=1 Tax=Coxiella endosymbiont of Ornithodoros maritimus TaxID=1656172 RepID=UPI0022645638|nr:GTPase Era [Coxiella endosymbiont of Ornithodoros maritimus]